MLLIWLIRKKTAMFNEFVLPVNFIKTPLTIALTTSMLAGCSMMPSLPTNNMIGRMTPTANKAPVKVRHAMPSVDNDNATSDNPLPLVVNKNTTTNQPTENAKVVLIPGAKGKLWNGIIQNDQSNILSNQQTNTNEALARIEAEKQRWLTAQRNSLNTSLRNAPTYLHYLSYKAQLRNLPTKLALLPLIESGYNPRAGRSSGTNAPAGLWQISYELAKSLNVKMNTSYDGRYDIQESTDIAYNYLGGLHRKYKGDWALILAAYNAGAPAVDKAIADNKAQGKPTDFWSLNLPKETMEYVPRFFALVDIIENSSRYGVELPFVDEVRQLQIIRVREGVKLAMIAPIASVPLETLKILNAGLLRDRIDTFTPMDIVLPFLVPAHIIHEIEKLPVNYTYNNPHIPSLDQPYEQGPYPNQPNQPQPSSPMYQVNQSQPNRPRPPRHEVNRGNQFPPQPHGDTYIVQAGDTLSELSQRFGIPRKVLARLNEVDSEYLVKTGETLRLTPNAKRHMGNVSANRGKKNSRRRQNQHLARQSNPNQNGNYTGNYIVQAGDTLWGIAKKKHTSVRAIASLNGFDTEHLVKTGESLTVPMTNAPKSVVKKPRRSINVRTKRHSGKYQVVRGDSLYSVALEHGLTQDQLARANNIDRETHLLAGQTINIPVNAGRPMSLNKQIRASASKPPGHKAPKKKFQRAKGVKSYHVQSGDSLTKLAQRYHVTVQTLAKMNGISPLSDLYTDTIIKVPKTKPSYDMNVRTGNTKYKVKKGEYLIELAKRFGISTNELAKMNGISATANLNLGQELMVPRH